MHGMILDDIKTYKAAELEKKERDFPLERLREIMLVQPPPRDLPAALSKEGIQLIAEIKQASPSRGILRSPFNPLEVAQSYAAGGAAAISILTETKYFRGSLDYLNAVKKALGGQQLPLLRKDFIFSHYQIYESRAYGADSLLLIVALLNPDLLNELLKLSASLDMSCLVEVHNEEEIEIALKSDARIIGINNRDLNTYKVDISQARLLRPLIPPGIIVVAESGIQNSADIRMLKQNNYDAVLIGEALISAADISAKMRELFT